MPIPGRAQSVNQAFRTTQGGQHGIADADSIRIQRVFLPSRRLLEAWTERNNIAREAYYARLNELDRAKIKRDLELRANKINDL